MAASRVGEYFKNTIRVREYLNIIFTPLSHANENKIVKYLHHCRHLIINYLISS